MSEGKDSSILEEAFSWIEQGNSFETNGEFWDAAAAFWQAKDLLTQLSTEPTSSDEETRIADLYRQQSHEYFNQSRQAFIKALESENKSDVERLGKDDSPKINTMSDEEAEARIRMFMTVWAKEIDLGETDEGKEEVPMRDLSELDLEARFRRLNDSMPHLPKPEKTEKQRLHEIDRGLGRLGLSLNLDTKPKFDLDIEPASKENQIADIIAQAKDEAEIEREKPMKEYADDNDDFLDFDPDLEEDEDDDLDEMSDMEKADRLKNKRMVKKHVVKAQAKLAELMALLEQDEGDGTQKPVGAVVDDGDIDHDSEDDEENNFDGVDVHFGKKLLKDSSAYLKRALQKWSAS